MASEPPARLQIPTRLRRIAGWRRYALVLGADAAVVSLAFLGGYLLRFEGHIPPDRWMQWTRFLPLLLAIRLPLHLAFGIHRWSFRLSGLYEAVQVILATAMGSAFFGLSLFFLQRLYEDVTLGPPASVVVLEYLLTTALLGFVRFSPRFAYSWSLDKQRSRSGSITRAVIVGAGSAGELLLRDLKRSDEHVYDIVGFVDDDPTKLWTSIGGRPVLGSIDSLPEIVSRRDVRELLFAIPRLPAARLREILTSCAEFKLSYRVLPVSFAYLNDRVSASMLQDLQPDDLLPRPEATFDSEAVGQRLRGRCVLVTGAAGSIGSELCRQIAPFEPSKLVLVDINENGLYMLARELEAHPSTVPFAVEIVDVCGRDAMARVFGEHRPDVVFHAAARKHVPLMESAPEEAVRTNVLGCRNVAEAASAAGAARFILISTDKAVNPTSIMGATKAVAEAIVRYLATRSSTRFTAVRFGNVLGSAASVVPLFKAQIAAGGPVTVTEPECTRYLMTIREAVGLVLLGGLADRGTLCILEMGEPMKISDLARLVITLAGHVPEEDIAITYTGLRPGERVHEQLMTDEEAAASESFAPGVRFVRTALPSRDLLDQIDRLGALAAAGERGALVALLREVVPSYVPSELWSEVTTPV